jgi:hypothetical protein
MTVAVALFSIVMGAGIATMWTLDLVPGGSRSFPRAIAGSRAGQ